MMRYFYVAFLLVVTAIVGVAGFRGSFSHRPPIELFSDMVRQPRLRPQSSSEFFSNHVSSRLQVEGTVAKSGPREINGSFIMIGGKPVYPYEDASVNTGRLPGTTNFAELNPLPITRPLLDRGQERFDIYCALCHSPSGDGRGVATKYGVIPANFHDKRLIEMSDGQIFTTITRGGASLMGAYGGVLAAEDRWAIVAYIRALQRSQLADTNDVPDLIRATLK